MRHQTPCMICLLCVRCDVAALQALEEIQNLLDLNPKQAELYVLRCRIHIKTKHLEQVVDDMTRLMQLEPNHPEASLHNLSPRSLSLLAGVVVIRW